MKTTAAVIPIAALLAGGIWITAQLRTISALENDNTTMQERIARSRPPTSARTGTGAARSALDEDPVNWTEVANQLKLARQQQFAFLSSAAILEARLLSLPRDEFLATLVEIADAELDKDSRADLEELISAKLIGFEGGVELVLDHFAGRKGNRDRPWLAPWLADWIASDPDLAIAWLNRNAAKPGVSASLVAASFYPRIISDPRTAARILTAFPESKRLGSLYSPMALGRLNKQQQVAWVRLIRPHVPEQDLVRGVTWPTRNWSDGDGSRMSIVQVGDYLAHIDATPAERDACILLAMQEGALIRNAHRDNPLPANEQLAAWRDWLADRAPHLIDQATGMALYGLLSRGDVSYPDVAELALRYHEVSRNDQILIPLLERPSGDQSRPTARVMAARLLDDDLRRQYLQKHP